MLIFVMCALVALVAVPVMLAAVVSAYLHAIGPIVCEVIAVTTVDSFNRVREAVQSLLPSPETSDEYTS